MENDKGMLVLEFEIILSEETTCRRPDLLWKEKEKKKTPGFAIRYIRDGEKDEIKKKEKQTTSRNVVLELRERRPGGGVEEAICEIEIFENNSPCKKIDRWGDAKNKIKIPMKTTLKESVIRVSYE